MCNSGYISNKLLVYPFRLVILNIQCIIIIDMYESLNKFDCVVLCCREHLLDILIKVNDEVCKAAKETDARVYKQTPAPLVSLRKKIYFL